MYFLYPFVFVTIKTKLIRNSPGATDITMHVESLYITVLKYWKHLYQLLTSDKRLLASDVEC